MPGEVIVKFKYPVISMPQSISAFNSKSLSIASLKIKDTFSSIGVKSIEKVFPDAKRPLHSFKIMSGKQIEVPDLTLIYLLKVPKESNIIQAIATLKNLEEIEYAEPNHICKAFLTPNDTFFSSSGNYQWGTKKISAEACWNISTGEAPVVVGVIDTGVAYTHEDLSGKVILGKDYVNNDNDPYDDNGHGTHLAGIIGAVTNNNKGIAGINWGAKILAVKALDNYGYGTATNVADGIAYAVSNAAKVINMSFGFYENNETIKSVIMDAYSAGCILVAAAGNENTSSRAYPAAYDDYVIAVAATDQNDIRSDWGTSQGVRVASNYGTWVDVCAPGSGILSTYPPNSYYNMNGTSMAAPHVSGIAALILSITPSFSQDDVRHQIENSCDNIDSLNPQFTGLLGRGRVNAARALGLPIAKITSPSNLNYITGSQNIQGTSTSISFLNYQVQLGSGTSPEIFETLFESTGQVNSGNLYEFNSLGKSDGLYTIKLVCHSSNGLTSEASVVVHIDNTTPEATISSPENNADEKGIITIKGTASDANLNYYTLSYSYNNGDLIRISSASTLPTDNVLGTWNTDGLTGLYSLRLNVCDMAGHENSKTINLNITSGGAASIEISGLSKSSPNPFNPSTQSETYVYYTLSNNYPTTLYIFSLTGEQIYVKTFESGQVGGKAGDNLVPWDGKNQFGTTVDNGIYFYKVAANNGGGKKLIGSGRIIVIR